MKRLILILLASATAFAGLATYGWYGARAVSPYAHTVDVALKASSGIHKIKHVIIIMQENRSFDSYFGTFPGADGIPMQNGVPVACVPDPSTSSCIKPFVDHDD